MIDAVLSYHDNPETSGVAKFNHLLAQKLGVPCHRIGSYAASRVQAPLISVKPVEIPGEALAWSVLWPTYDLFLHVWTDTLREHQWVADARTIYAANREIADHVQEAIVAWCPSLLTGNHSRGLLHILTFGMAHKLHLHRYRTVKRLLDQTEQNYTVSVSTAVHEGSPWDHVADRKSVV